MDLLKKSVEIGLSPIGIMVALIALGVLVSFSRRHVRAGHRLLMAGGLLFLVFLFSPISEIVVRSLEIRFSPLLAPPPNPKIERIVVLSGYGESHPEYPITSNLSEQTASSLVEGMRLYRLIPGSKLVLSGGVVKAGDKAVGALMADFLRQMGIPSGDIIVEGLSTNTFENLANTKALVGTAPFILVATACDLRRAVAVARKLGMQPMPAPAGIWTLQNWPVNMSSRDWVVNVLTSVAYPSHNRLSRLQWAYHEYLGYVWYSLLDRV